MVEESIHARVDDQTGEALSVETYAARLHARVTRLRKIAFTDYPSVLKDVIFCGTGELTNPSTLSRLLAPLGDEDLLQLATKLGVVTDKDTSKCSDLLDRPFIHDLLLFCFAKHGSELDQINQLSLYPTESTLWDNDLIPHMFDSTELDVYPLPKLNLQFLSVYDYLRRNFELYRLETAYSIRLDIVDAVKRMNPTGGMRVSERGATSSVTFNGWARMAVPIASFSMSEVQKPRIGQVVPSRVTCSLEIDLSRFNDAVKDEWEGLRVHDVVFLVCIEGPKRFDATGADEGGSEETDLNQFRDSYGVKYVRGAEVYEIRDEEGIILNDANRYATYP